MFGFQDRSPGTPTEAVKPRELQHPTEGNSLVDALVDYSAVDNKGIIGVVDEILPDGSIRITCGWFGRGDLIVPWSAVRQVHDRDHELVLHDALPHVAEIRSASGVYARLMARLAGWSLGSPHAAP